MPLDLSETRHLLEPKTEKVEKTLCCLCCQSGPIYLRAEVQKQAFQAGEPLVFLFELNNKATNKPLRKVEARVMQRVIFYSSSREETQKFTLCSEVLSEGISPGGEGTWKDARLNLPADTVPNFKYGVTTTQPGLMQSENGLPNSDTVVYRPPQLQSSGSV